MINRNIGVNQTTDEHVVIKPKAASKTTQFKESSNQARRLNIRFRGLEQQNARLLLENAQLKSTKCHLEGQLKTFEILLKEFERQFKSQEQNFEKRFEFAIKSITSESINWRNQYQEEIGRLISSSTEQFARLHHRFYRIMKREAYLTEKLKRQRESTGEK